MARPLTISRWLTTISTAQVKYGTGSGNFIDPGSNSVNPYLEISDSSFSFGTGNFTIEFWVYRDFVNSSSGRLCFINSGNNGLNHYELLWVNDDFVFASQYYPGSTNDVYASTGGGNSPLPLNEWHHIAVVRDGTDIDIYLNGVRKGGETGSITKSVPGGGGTISIGYADLTSGGGSGYIWDLDGVYLDDYRISNTARYTADFTPPGNLIDDTNTLLLLKFNGTNGSTNIVDTVNYTLSGAANLSAAFTVAKADGRTYLRAGANFEALATELAVQNPSPSMVYLENDVFTWADTDTWDTIYDSDDKWAVWERLNASFSITAIGSDFDIASSSILFEAGLEVSAGVQKNGQANLSDAFTQTAKAGFLVGIDDPYDYTWDTIPEDQWNSFFKDLWRPDGWFAFDEVTITSRGGLELNATATLSGQATVEIDARLSDVRGSAELSAQYTVASGSDVYRNASATLEAFATEVTVGRTSDVRASAQLNAVFTLESGSDNSKSGSADLTATADLSAVSTVDHTGSATLAGEFTQNTQARILKLANLDITSLGDMTVSGSMTLNAGAGLQGAFTETVQAGYQLSGQTNLVTEFTSVFNATLIPSVELDEVAFNADLTARGAVTYGASARLEAFAAEVTAGQRAVGGRANLEAAFTTIVSGTAIFSGSANLEAFATELVAGRISTTRGSATLAGTFVAEFAGELKLLDSQFIYKILKDTRTYGIESEIRKYDVLSENRIFDIDAESRDYQVLPENRTVDVGYFMQ